MLILNKTITEFEMKSNNWCRNKYFKLSIDTVIVSVDDCKMITFIINYNYNNICIYLNNKF